MLFVGTSIIHHSTEGVFLLCNILDLLIYSLEERLNHVLLERMLVEEIIPMVEKKYQFGGCKEKRGMAGLSMGSVQTTRTVCDHPDLFSEVGIFSGFLRDFIEGDPDRDVVDRKPYE